jgi:hypothetical protein
MGSDGNDDSLSRSTLCMPAFSSSFGVTASSCMAPSRDAAGDT